MPAPRKRMPTIKKPSKLPREPVPPPKTDDPTRDKTTIKDGVIQPLPAAD